MTHLLPYEGDMPALCNDLQQAEGYLACEQIILQSIKKQAGKGLDDINIEQYLRQLSGHIERLIAESADSADATNYRYASGFLTIILRTPSWSSWVKTIEI